MPNCVNHVNHDYWPLALNNGGVKSGGITHALLAASALPGRSALYKDCPGTPKQRAFYRF